MLNDMQPCSLLRRASLAAHRGPIAAASVGAAARQQVRWPSAVAVGLSSSSGDVFSPANVLSEDSRQQCLRRLSRIPSLRPPTPPPPGATAAVRPKEAAVLVPLCVVGGEVCLLFTLRSPTMSSHRGQVSFPGGMKDDSDGSHEATALRETEEELSIPKESIEVWGRCPAMESANKVTVVPVIGYLGHINVEELNFNPDEVGDVFTISLQHLCDKENFRFTQFRTGKGYSIPVFLNGKYRVWGLTAGVTHIFLSALLQSVYKSKVLYCKPVQPLCA